MKITPEMMVEDEQRWHARDVIAELGYCGNYMRDRKDMTNLDIRFYAYLMRKAHDMLKAREPRVMTLDETIASCENPVWLEENTLQGSYGAWGVVKGVREKYNAVNIGGVRFGYWPREKYNISWRCWTARPTEEQRKAVLWDG